MKKEHKLVSLASEKYKEERSVEEIKILLSKYNVEPKKNRKRSYYRKKYNNYFHFQNIIRCEKYLKNRYEGIYDTDCLKIDLA